MEAQRQTLGIGNAHATWEKEVWELAISLHGAFIGLDADRDAWLGAWEDVLGKERDRWFQFASVIKSWLSSGKLAAVAKPGKSTEAVNHPAHYGGADNVYETIKVIEAWGLGFNLGNAIKYISRHVHKAGLEDLKKGRWYLDREITRMEGTLK